MNALNSNNWNLNLKLNEFYSYQQLKGDFKIGDKKFSGIVEVESYTFEFSLEVGKNSKSNFKEQNEVFDLSKIGYTGKKIKDLTQDEAKELVGENGFFGIKQTSQRVADFVIKGAGGDAELLKAGREGILKGFKEAEEMWGSKLFDISYDTLKETLRIIDEEFGKLGIPLLDTKS